MTFFKGEILHITRLCEKANGKQEQEIWIWMNFCGHTGLGCGGVFCFVLNVLNFFQKQMTQVLVQ